MLKLIIILESAIRNNCFKLKGLLLFIYLKLHKCNVGHNLRCHRFPVFRIIPNNNIVIGNNVTIGSHITFEVNNIGKIIIGDSVKLTQNIIICSGSEVLIGANSILGENISIRDGEHNTSLEDEIINQGSNFQPVKIGRGVWIGAASLVLKGSEIPDGVVIGANSVVTSSCKLLPNNIYAGSPVRFIKSR